MADLPTWEDVREREARFKARAEAAEQELAELRERYDELHDRKMNEGCDECEDRREAAEQRVAELEAALENLLDADWPCSHLDPPHVQRDWAAVRSAARLALKGNRHD